MRIYVLRPKSTGAFVLDASTSSDLFTDRELAEQALSDCADEFEIASFECPCIEMEFAPERLRRTAINQTTQPVRESREFTLEEQTIRRAQGLNVPKPAAEVIELPLESGAAESAPIQESSAKPEK